MIQLAPRKVRIKLTQIGKEMVWMAYEGRLMWELKAKTEEEAIIEWAERQARMAEDFKKRVICI